MMPEKRVPQKTFTFAEDKLKHHDSLQLSHENQ